MEFFQKILAFILAVFGLAPGILAQNQQSIPENTETCSVTIMSSNVYVAGVGKKSPESRSAGVINNMRSVMPDVFGLQEADAAWMQRIIKGMPEYSYVGRGRDKNENDGEYSPIFYKTEKYNLINSGTFWFSDTPDVPSRSWGTLYNRICSWAVLEDKATGFTFAVFNSHWDHISVTSRNKSAELLSEKTEEYASNMPVVITGDFNCKANTVAYQTLVNSGFTDVMYVADETSDIGTYHGYKGTSTNGELPIDHILFRNNTAYASVYKVITDKYDGIYPSDHFPIVSELTLYR